MYSAGPYCYTCQVIFQEGVYNRLEKMRPDEYSMLYEQNPSDTQRLYFPLFDKISSRLACCLLVEDWMDNAVIEMGHDLGFAGGDLNTEDHSYQQH